MSFHVPPELAYIGPGAGFAFLGSFLTLLGGLLLGVVSVLLWPFRLAWRAASGRQGYKNAKIRKLIFLGLDGLDPGLVEKFMAAGRLPNLSRLREQGGFNRLRTTFPALSPVAWSTFATGVNPARHSMFDFLNRSLHSYMPELSSTRVSDPRRVLSLGKYRIPLSRPGVLVDNPAEGANFYALPVFEQVGVTFLNAFHQTGGPEIAPINGLVRPQRFNDGVVRYAADRILRAERQRAG